MSALILKLSHFHIILSAMLDKITAHWHRFLDLSKDTLLRIMQGLIRAKDLTIRALNVFCDAVVDGAVHGIKKGVLPFLMAWAVISNIRLPKISPPEIRMPQFKMPAVSLPKMPSIRIPEIRKPALNIALPKIKWPALPRIEIPTLPTLKKEVLLNHTALNICLIVFVLVGITGMARSMPAHQALFSKIEYAFLASDHSAGTPLVNDFMLAQKEPAAGDPIAIATDDEQRQNREDNSYAIEENSIEVEGVLVPQKSTVISSSRDGKIRKIHFDDGEVFAKGDVLIEYDCDDLLAELSAIDAQNELSVKKGTRGEKLFKLEIISDIERLDLQNEATKVLAQKRIVEARMQSCEIIAAYDGRVVNRLANDNEYTRTDRVLMEIGSLENLEVEFLLPSKWLRWVNIGAPLTINLFETGREYKAHISRIHGEVDPVSQSIQMTAALSPYEDPLLPGMSGEVEIDIQDIRDQGVVGYLER